MPDKTSTNEGSQRTHKEIVDIIEMAVQLASSISEYEHSKYNFEAALETILKAYEKIGSRNPTSL